ncbi:TetR family transcriptional regulator [Streptomyces tateyamensis]|uniref:TetR family transcriptional regulator n=1 Tax=Streptomyces tateyamensis TaxID=565073 RepID=A0A2V4N807_9ACTN|nr:TetR family transcriptional regulator [Streptomyces tateyamensis]PYC67356.1 TetR family transcriptional regulator [Streptomyces tateyamensis]
MAPTSTAFPAPGSDPAAAESATTGLRERKKQRTREALVDAAHRLFLSQGYAGTTVDEIAAAVDVSQRTFFRYFANKEEAALAVMSDAEDHFIELLRARPAGEPPLPAMREAICATWRDFSASHHPAGRGVTAALELVQLIETTPTLLAAHLRRSADQERRVAEILAAREGVDPAADLRPRLLAAVFGAAVRTAHLAWTAGAAARPAEDDGPEGLIAVIQHHLDQLGPALAADWSDTARGI